MPETVARHCSMLAKLQPRIPEMLVMQYSPACAAGAAIATKASADSAAADAVIILEIGFIFLSIHFKKWSDERPLSGFDAVYTLPTPHSTVTSHFFELSSVAEAQCSHATLNDNFCALFDLHQCSLKI